MKRIAIVGRPNVGKSTLFNRLVGKRIALVDDQPGVTRDRRDAEIEFAGQKIILVDTAGFEDATDESLQARMRAGTEDAIRCADLTLFVIDARTGVTSLDEIFAEAIRRADVPVILVANKSEGRAAESGIMEAYRLGYGEPVAVSAEHGIGMPDLVEAVSAAFPESEQQLDEIDAEPDDQTAMDSDEFVSGPLRIAIVGRPNAGKSTLINRLIGEERMLTGPEAGITRDTISVDLMWGERALKLFDTAGMRKKARVSERLEKMSVGETLRAIRFAHVVILMSDVDQPLEKQDIQIADLVIREGRALILAVNKIDQATELDDIRRDIRLEAERLLPQVRGLPVHFVSAQTGRGVDKLLNAIFALYETWNRRIATAALNRWLEDALAAHPPPAPSGRRIRIRYVTQAKSRPPTFIAFCSRPDALAASYQRYLLNGLRETFDLDGIPLRLTLRKGENPYADKKRR